MAQTTSIANYIIDRLAALGARHIFGVPGNYTAQFLSAIEQDKRLTYVGTTNELEAGYAADALSRLPPATEGPPRRGIGVACVTYGVGSFSLYNAIAGAFVERCPVVLVNGTANADKARQLKEQGVLFAHAIDPLRTDEAIFRPVTAATAVITDPADAPRQIDRTLRALVAESRPVYLEVPDGVWTHPCAAPADPPRDQPLVPLPLGPGEDEDIRKATEAAIREVLARARQAAHPVLWGGEWLLRLRLEAAFERLVSLTGWPYTTTLLGKGLISETNPHFIGVYDSAFAPANVQKVVEGTDCLIALGTILSDFYGAIVGKKFGDMVLVAGGAVRVGGAVYPNVPLDRFLDGLIAALQLQKRALASGEQPGGLPAQTPPPGFKELRASRESRRTAPAPATAAAADGDALTWDSFFAAMRRRNWKGWRLMVDTSMAIFPSAELLVEEAGHFIAQTAWLSIGYTTGGALGASFAADAARVAVFTGDGGFQMLPQALSTLARARKPTVFFLLDNGLYGIEQFLIDKTYFGQTKPPEARFFNQLPRWNYKLLAEAFGAAGFVVDTLGGGSQTGLPSVLAAIDQLKDQPALVAVRLSPRDLPAELRPKSPGAAAARPTPTAEAGATPEPATVAPAAFN